MKTKVIKTEEEYNKACARIYQLINSTDKPIDATSTEGEEMEILALLIEKYERGRYALMAPDPVQAIKFRMEQMNLKQTDIAPLFGGKTRVSEVLNGKRQLTLKMIRLLNTYLGIPLESLMNGKKKSILDTASRKKILSIHSIRDYVKSNPV